MNSSFKVLYFGFANEALYELIRSHAPEWCEVMTLKTNTIDERMDKLPEATAVIHAGPYFGQSFIDVAKNLRLVNFQGVGYQDSIDAKALAAAGIPLAIAPGGTAEGVSEHTIMLMLAAYKRLAYVDAEIRRGVWHAHDLRTESRQLFGKTVGIVGLGRIGRAVAARLRPFGVKVVYTDIVDMPQGLEEELGVTRMSLDALLSTSDIVTLHVPLVADTHHLMNAERLALMKRGAVVINCARGPVVDQQALAAALQSGHIGGAGLDVMEVEPPAHPTPFDEFRNVVLTPHIAPGTIDAMNMKMADCFANVRRLYHGEPLVDVVNEPLAMK